MAFDRQVANRQPCAAQPDVCTVGKALVPKTGIIRSAMRLNRVHARQGLPIAAINDAANAAHEESVLSQLEFVYFCFDMKKLYALQGTINQPRNAVHKAQPERVFVDKEHE